jgi:YD repeat-containing protein
VTDDGGQTATISSTITITAATTSITATEGLAFSGVVGSFTGNPAQATSASITWGDGTAATAGTITSTGGNSFTVSGSHTYSDEGTNALAVTVQMSVGGPLSVSGPAKVQDAALSAQGVNLTGTDGQPLAPVQATVATFTDANPQATVADFTATINWGDGSSAAGTVAVNGSGFQVLGDHTYDNAGSFTITTTIVDDGGSTATATGNASGGPDTISLTEGQDESVSLTVAAPAPSGTTPSDGTTYQATIDWGDGSTSPGDVTPLTGGSGNLQLDVTGDHVYTEEGSYTITATVDDPEGDPTTASQPVTVNDAALDSSGQSFTAVAGESTGQVLVATFSDSNPYATTADFTASINWGDGSSSGGTIGADANGGFTVTGSHTYALAGVYSVQTTISDDGGQQTVANGTATVVAPWGILAAASGERDGGGNDPERQFLLPIGEAQVDLNQGALRLRQPLDFDQSPGTSVGRDPALVYNSATVNVRPIIQVAVQTDPLGPVPVQAQVQLTWNGVNQGTVPFSASGQQPGAIYILSVQAPLQSTSGAYPWAITVTLLFSDNSTRQATTSGTAYVVARNGSPYGPGWGIDGLDQLFIGSTGILWVTGSGDSRFFAAGGGGSFTSPAEDFGTLAANGGGYTYTAKDQTLLNFSSTGLLTSVVDTHGLATLYSYDSASRLSQVTATDGGITTLGYDSLTGVVNRITEPGGRLVQIVPGSVGDLMQITDADGSTRVLGYDLYHHLTSDQWAPLSATFTYVTTTLGNGLLTNVNLGLGSSYAIVSAAAQGLGSITDTAAWTSVTDGRNDTTSYLLDGRGRLLAEVQADRVNSYVYYRDGAGQVTAQVDPEQHATLYSYIYGPYNANLGGGDGDLLQVTHADGSFESYRYDPTFHHVTQTADRLGVTSTNSYDPSTGDLLSASDALGNTTSYVWSAGLLQSTTDPRGDTTSYLYDGARRLLVDFDAQGTPTLHQYDGNGNPAFTQDVYGRVTQTAYNARNLLVGTVDANGGTTSDSYNAYGEKTSDTNERGFTETTNYDQRGWQVSATDFAGATSTEQYDAAGNVTQSTDGRGEPTYFSYDVDNRGVSTQDALGNTATNQYDGDGNVASSKDALGRTTSFAHDVLDRLFSSTDPLGRTNKSVYDWAGDLVRSVDGRACRTRCFWTPTGGWWKRLMAGAIRRRLPSTTRPGTSARPPMPTGNRPRSISTPTTGRWGRRIPIISRPARRMTWPATWSAAPMSAAR